MKKDLIIISVLSSVVDVRETFKNTNICDNYNTKHYLMAIIDEILNNKKPLQKDDTPLPLSTRILIADGMDTFTAMTLSARIYLNIIDSISAILPGITFGDGNKFSLELSGNYDLYINVI